LAPVAWAEPAATLLFTQAGTQIVDPQGISRAAKQGDILATGERLLTPPGAITQIRLPDGSLVGMRPGSELKIDLPPKAAPDAGNIVSLQQGALRLIGAELMDAKKRSSVTLQSGNATMKLVGADLQSALVRPGDNNPQGSGEAGAYNRLLTGSGSIGSGSGLEQLAVRQTSFVGASGVAPVTLALAPSSVFVGAPPAVVPVTPSSTLNPPPALPALAKILNSPSLTIQLPPIFTVGGPTFPKPLPIPPISTPIPVPILVTDKPTGSFATTAATNLALAAPTATVFIPQGLTLPVATLVAPIVTAPLTIPVVVAPTSPGVVAPVATLVTPPSVLISPITTIVIPKTSCITKILAGIRICI
jgi:FecR protein